MVLITDRKEKILHILIQEYVRTGRPVGSKFICENYDIGYSPATVRNDLSELEEEGFLSHPHTSAGRMPTDKGYRNYVDRLVEIQRLAKEEEDRIRYEFDTRISELEDIMKQTSCLLAEVSHYAGFVITPSFKQNLLQHIELIKLEGPRILAIIVTNTGIVKHKIIQCDVNISKDRVKSLSKILNSKLHCVPISKIKGTLEDEIKKEQKHYEQMRKLTYTLTDYILGLADENLLYMEGASNIIEFERNATNIKSVYKIIEQRNMLLLTLKKNIKKQGVDVCIGKENIYKEMEDCSLVKSTYKLDNKIVGVLGIIGPKRMEYSRMIALVDFVSKMITKSLAIEEKV